MMLSASLPYRPGLCSLLIWLAVSFSLYAQHDPILRYQQRAGNHALLYNGEEELKYTRKYLNQPYYRQTECAPGDLYAFGRIYKQIDMRIDLYKNQLIVRSPDQRFHIVIPGSGVDSVKLHGHTFIYSPAGTETGELPPGYYFLLHKGTRCILLGRGWMEPLRQETNNIIRIRFKPTERYYFFDGQAWKTISGKSALLSRMQGRQKEMKAFIKKNQLDFRKNKEEALTATARYYESLP